ncbi:MAG TPA: four helix bundle protein, partial [Chitinophagaceae bacterium]|nr:four helix bundle protein [Chitinophagaceae bacterium]
MKSNVIKDKSFAFAIRIIELYQHQINEHKEFVISKQLFRSGTAVGALVRESINAESRADFVHKLGIAQKECDETIYWLELIYATNYISLEEFESIYDDATELLKI